MTILGLIVFAAVILFVCERWVGRRPAIEQHDPERPDQSLSDRLSSREIVFRLMPIFLGGIGLPLLLAHPIPGLLCLSSALALFLAGGRKGV